MSDPVEAYYLSRVDQLIDGSEEFCVCGQFLCKHGYCQACDECESCGMMPCEHEDGRKCNTEGQ